MSHPTRSPVVRLALALLGALCFGMTCSPGASKVKVTLVPSATSVPALTWIDVDVMVTTTHGPIQAFEFDAHGTLGTLWIDEVMIGDFDDDGQLFGTPTFGVGAADVTGIVDVRHGPGASGTVRLARLRVLALAPGTGTLSLSGGGLVGPDGSLQPVSLSNATITVGP